MKSNNEYVIDGSPRRAKYRRNDNGLYTIEIDKYIATSQNGCKYKAILRFPNAKLPEWVTEESGVIDFNEEGIKHFSVQDEASNIIFELVIPEEIQEFLNQWITPHNAREDALYGSGKQIQQNE